ncbi:MAG: hypothetical protein JWQ07_3028 [Ramlibacter sp.]|nr:hypothetical protein [Ramlibacter sp.]
MERGRSGWTLAAAIAMLGLGAVLLLVSVAMQLNAATQPTGKMLLHAAPYFLLAGFALLVVFAVLRPKPDPQARTQDEPTLFGKDTTEFASQMDELPDRSRDPHKR